MQRRVSKDDSVFQAERLSRCQHGEKSSALGAVKKNPG